ncbi:hypothetical protein [Winogradskyella poriferorum]|uniref:hypothetical protein n=1 Tax=Winogradskyella poriferorum TaxID=307627 RepID=UPI003D65185E
MNEEIIVSESNRPFWQIIVASLFFTLATVVLLLTLYSIIFTNEKISVSLGNFNTIIIFISIGIGFCVQKRIYVDLANSKFRPSYEIGPIKIGKWQQIINYEYISIFTQPLKDGGSIFEVNLWYDRNKHFKLYEGNDYLQNFMIGFEISEKLNIDLLDATVPNDYKWIDKDEWKSQMNESNS